MNEIDFHIWLKSIEHKELCKDKVNCNIETPCITFEVWKTWKKFKEKIRC